MIGPSIPESQARHAPATERNREPILAVLRDTLPAAGLVLEVASGTGEHVRFFAERMRALEWQPTDPDPEARASIAAWSDGFPNIRPPLLLDAAATDWPIARADALLCINMVHISPWGATQGLFAGAARLLPPGAPLVLYGPYRETTVPTAQSNEAFDVSLKARDPAWGLRTLDAMTALAEATGFALDRRVEMPAYNVSLVFRKARPPS